jgi:uncharacterized membrane protein YfcA
MQVTLPQELLLALIGAVAGFMNVMAGGGSLLTLPAMVLFGLPGPLANGTNRVAILIQNLSAISGFFKQGFSDFRLSLTLALCAFPGAMAGAMVGVRLQGDLFNRVLAAVMIGVMVLMARGSSRTEVTTGPISRRRLLWAHVLMVGAGFYGGFIQAGVGFILMAILYRVLRLDLVRVNMHKVFIVAVYTIPALVVFALNGNVLWRTGLFLAAGNATGGWIASHVAVKKGERVIRVVLFLALTVMAVKLLLS